jgi:hypothetical protein
MKKILTLLALSSFLFTGCALIPKPVEFFQKKVKSFPEPTSKQVEVQKQTAQRAKEAAQATLSTAVDEGASTNLVATAKDTAVLTDAVSTSLGPPVKPSVAPAQDLSTELLTQVAKLNRKIDAFAEANEKVEGKKIEGTGVFSVPYFVYAGGFVLLVVVGWHLAKTALMAGSIANPAIAPLLGLANGGMNAAGAAAGKGLQQVVAGGSAFLKKLETEVTDPALRQRVKDLFVAAHKEAQDADVKVLVDKLK